MDWGRVSAGIALALALIVGGCTATSLKPETTKNAHTIGIISAIGDDLVYRNVPFFRWGQEEYHRDVKDLYWKVSTAGALPDAGPIGNTVHDHVRRPKVDLYVVVLAGSAPGGMTVTSAEGMGVLRYPDFGDDRYYVSIASPSMAYGRAAGHPECRQQGEVSDGRPDQRRLPTRNSRRSIGPRRTSRLRPRRSNGSGTGSRHCLSGRFLRHCGASTW